MNKGKLAFYKGGKIPKYYWGQDEINKSFGTTGNHLNYNKPTFSTEGNPDYLNNVVLGKEYTTPTTTGTEVAAGGTPKFDIAGAVGMGANVLGGLWDKNSQKTSTDVYGTEYKTQDVGDAFGSNALKGAGMGASFGPVGAVVGGIGMGVYGAFTANKENERVAKAKEEALTRKSNDSINSATQMDMNYRAQGFKSSGQYGSMYRKGGYIKKYPEGGLLQAYYDSIKGKGIQGKIGKDVYLAGDLNDLGYAVEAGTGSNSFKGSVGYGKNIGKAAPFAAASFAPTIGNENFSFYPAARARYSFNGTNEDSFAKVGAGINLGGEKITGNLEAGYELINKTPYAKIGLGYTFAEGGNLTPEYEVEHDEVVEGQGVQLEGQEDLSSNMTRAVGETHANGGVKGAGGDRVYSNRIYPTQNLISYLSANKIPVKYNMTIADIAAKLGRMKGKFEDKLGSHNPLTYNTGKAMTGRMEQATEMVFQDQESQKGEQQQVSQYAKGGDLPDWNTLGDSNYAPDNSPVRIANSGNEFIARETEKDVAVKQIVANPVVIPAAIKAKFKMATESVDSNAMKAIDFYVKKGLSREAAAGIVGNLYHESGGVNPKSKQVDGGGYGIAQWTTKARKFGLEEYAKTKKTLSDDLTTQLEYLYKEMEDGKIAGHNVVDKIKSYTNIDKATEYFEKTMEKAGIKNNYRRKGYANNLYNFYSDYVSQGKYAKGGYLKKYDGGGTFNIEAARKDFPGISDDVITNIITSRNGQSKYPMAPTNSNNPNNLVAAAIPNAPVTTTNTANPSNTTNSPISEEDKLALQMPYGMINKGYKGIMPSYATKNNNIEMKGNENTTPLSTQPMTSLPNSTAPATDNTPTGNPKNSSFNWSKANEFISPEQGINAGVYLNNLKNADKQQTGFNRQVATPAYMRNTNMLPYNVHNIKSQARQANTAITNASGNIQDTFNRKASINAGSMDAINTATANQLQSDNATNNQNTMISNDYLNRKTGAANEDQAERIMGRNTIINNKNNANNTFLSGVMGNVASHRAYGVEQDKNEIARMVAGKTGTDFRSTVGKNFNSIDYDSYNKAMEVYNDKTQIGSESHKRATAYLQKSGYLAKGGYLKRRNKTYC